MLVSEKRPIALVGLMGAGKSAVARELGERLGTSVADLDALIESEEGRSITAMFEAEGESWFRSREGDLLRRVLHAGARVIACGGGIVRLPENRALLHSRCFTAWLEVTPAEAARRLADTTGTRPLLAGAAPAERLERLLGERRAAYAEVAAARFPTEGRTPAEVAVAVLDAWRAPR
jgi:shikimate kinase